LDCLLFATTNITYLLKKNSRCISVIENSTSPNRHTNNALVCMKTNTEESLRSHDQLSSGPRLPRIMSVHGPALFSLVAIAIRAIAVRAAFAVIFTVVAVVQSITKNVQVVRVGMPTEDNFSWSRNSRDEKTSKRADQQRTNMNNCRKKIGNSK
jgi:hypothetical protein